MTNLERINQVLVRELKEYNGTDAPFTLVNYLKQKDITSQITKWTSIQKLGEMQWILGASSQTRKIVTEIFSKEFRLFLEAEGILDKFIRITLSSNAQAWRDELNQRFMCNDLDDFLFYFNPRYYVARCWQWSTISSISGCSLNDKWMKHIVKILLKKYEF